MASWLVHLRVANSFLDVIKSNNLDETNFLVGSIAPDCGIRCENGFNPPAKITHFSPSGLKRDCQTELFFNKYIKDEKDIDALSFYIGYYIHLITDNKWSKNIFLPIENKYLAVIPNKAVRHKMIKQNWCNLDFKFLKENGNFEAYNHFIKINDWNKKYLEFYTNNEIDIQLKHIKNYYKQAVFDKSIPNTFITENTINEFVEKESKNILQSLTHKLKLKDKCNN